jgi:hypothetical protein
MSHETQLADSAAISADERLRTSPVEAVSEPAAIRNVQVWVLVNDILDFSKIEAGTPIVRRERFSPREVLCDVDMALAARTGKPICV